MAKKFSALRDKMSADARGRAKARTEVMLVEMALPELRKAFDVSQEDLAKLLRVTQASISKTENRGDWHLSTIIAYINALGGEVEILAHFPKMAGKGDDDVVRLKPFLERRAA
ncbi:MAG: helix-turn-helix domain-containing protein [Burkholderiales bacterium]